MYNQVKALASNGYSKRAIAKQLKINRRTVSKLINLDISSASDYFKKGAYRSSGFDIARDFIESKLNNYPDIRSSNLYHQVLKRYPEITLKERSFRHYVSKLKSFLNLPSIPKRYFEPVTDWESGRYMQVDPGEQSVVLTDGNRMKLYFVSFVLCYSRQFFIHYSTKPYNTDSFIDAHFSAFSYFGGIPKVGVYDQTKLVAIREEYREVLYNNRFQMFFLKLGFQADVCEGYDPQSKGMVEKSVDYIKSSFLYGREFIDISDVRIQSDEWLATVANKRVHQTTLRRPCDLFLEEQLTLQSSSEICCYSTTLRKVDKTGLISFEGCFYSVPFRFQSKQVTVRLLNKLLHVYDPETNDLVTIWDVGKYNRRVNKNDKHYLDYKTSIEEELRLSKQALKDYGVPRAEQLLTRLETDNVKHLRGQCQGLRRNIKKFDQVVWSSSIEDILALPLVTCSRICNLLNIMQQKMDKDALLESLPTKKDSKVTKNCFRSLSYYEPPYGATND